MYTALLPLIHDPEKELDSASDTPPVVTATPIQAAIVLGSTSDCPGTGERFVQVERGGIPVFPARHLLEITRSLSRSPASSSAAPVQR